MTLLVNLCVRRGCKPVMHCRCVRHLAALAAWGTVGFCAGLDKSDARHASVPLRMYSQWLLGLEDVWIPMLQARRSSLARVVTWHGRVTRSTLYILQGVGDFVAYKNIHRRSKMTSAKTTDHTMLTAQ